MARLLPTPYFHGVFTLPAALRGLVLHNRRRLFALLFAAASQTLLTLGRDRRRLGATLGTTAVLHTWTRDLQFHPHVHCLVTGLAVERPRWIAARRRYLLPVKVLSRLFRGKFLAALARARERGELQFPAAITDWADAGTFGALLDQLYRQEWVVYAKRPFGGPTQVFHYLGRYTHRVGLSTHHLQAITAAVRFATKDGHSVTVPPPEFLRRFLLHVLPAGFVKIRHFGLFAARQVPTALAHARRLLVGAAPRTTTPPPAPRDWQTLLRRLTGVDLARCPRCAHGTMIRHLLPSGAPVYAPP